MTSPPSSRSPHNPQTVSLGVTQLIYAMLIVGILAFTIVAATLGQGQQPPTPPAPTPPAPGTGAQQQAPGLWIIVLGVWPILIIASFATPVVMTRQIAMEWGRNPVSEETWFSHRFQTVAIVRAAMIEGAGLMAAAIAFVDADMRPLAFAVGSILLLAATFPTRAAFARFAERVTGGKAIDGGSLSASVHADPRRNPN